MRTSEPAFSVLVEQVLAPIHDAGLHALRVHRNAQASVFQRLADLDNRPARGEAQVADHGKRFVHFDLRADFEIGVFQFGVYVGDVLLIAQRDTNMFFVVWLGFRFRTPKATARLGLVFGRDMAQKHADAVGGRGQFGIRFFKLGDDFFGLVHHRFVGFDLFAQGHQVAQTNIVARGHANDFIKQPQGAQLHFG